jgi:hypothetical protein
MRPANHHGALAAGEGTGQPRNRLFERHRVAGEHVLDVAEAERADMIALGWSQQLDPGRARTIRRAVLDAVVPVMLVPMGPG